MRRSHRAEKVTTLVTKVCFGELTGQPVKCLSDRTICRLLEELQPDLEIPPQGEKERELMKALKAELLRRTFLVIEQEKLENQHYKLAIAG
jgi:hypothetical protein